MKFASTYEWRVKETVCPPKIEYDFWINEKTLTFCIFPKEHRKKPFERYANQKSSLQKLDVSCGERLWTKFP